MVERDVGDRLPETAERVDVPFPELAEIAKLDP